MKTTFIIRNLTEATLAELEAMPARLAHDKLAKWAFGDLKHCVSVQYGNGSRFGDRVEWNSKMKSNAAMTVKAEPRRGYRLFTFTA